jgi:hypothetical protein
MAQTAALEPNRDQIEIFVQAIFRHAKAGFVSLRAFYEGEDKVFRVEPVPTSAANFYKYLCDVAQDIARRAAPHPKAVVFCPPLATFSNKDKAGEEDIAEGLTLSVECDENPEAARAMLEPLLGPVTVAVRSGGIWQSNGISYAKQHLHWRLSEPARSKEQLAKLKRAREIACHLVGADPTTAPVCHPLRWPGSWHRKAEPRPCEIIIDASNFDHEIDLDEVLTRLEPLAPATALGGNGAHVVQPGGEWGELAGKIVRGETLHKSITRLAMKMVKGGTPEVMAVQILRGLLEASQAPRDWQHVLGKPAARGYHNKEWAAKMKAIGLQPSNTGAVGGKETGQQMSHYIIPDGPFAKAFAALAATGWRLNLQSAHRAGAKGGANSKTKFTCPSCGWNVWGKPDTSVFCKPCWLANDGRLIELVSDTVAVLAVQSYDRACA